MNTLRILLLIALGISILYSLVKSIVLRMPSASRDAARTRLASAQWLDDKAREGSLVKLTGTVRLREAGERFVGPLTENRCVALHLRALVRHGRGVRGKLVEKLDITPFVIEDQDGKVLVEATHALLDIAPTRPKKASEPRKLLAALGHEDANPESSRCEETTVDVGATVTVAGTLVTSPETKLVGDANNPIVIRVERARANLALEP